MRGGAQGQAGASDLGAEIAIVIIIVIIIVIVIIIINIINIIAIIIVAMIIIAIIIIAIIIIAIIIIAIANRYSTETLRMEIGRTEQQRPLSCMPVPQTLFVLEKHVITAGTAF